MRWIGKFFVAEKSKFTSFGPIMVLRPALPSRFAQYTCPEGGGATAPGNEAHCEAYGDEAGTVGNV